MLRLHRPAEERLVGAHCLLVFPGTTERRWLEKPPTRGTRLRSNGGHGYGAQVFVVEEVVQSGQTTYAVFCVRRNEYLDNIRKERGRRPDLAAALLELVRHTRSTAAERKRRRKYRTYLP
jgi:hypothetical protein